jgi:hypothetical protein
MDFRFNDGFSQHATQRRSVGGIFSYAGQKMRSSDIWYWFVNFFGQEFLVMQTIQQEQGKTGQQSA